MGLGMQKEKLCFPKKQEWLNSDGFFGEGEPMGN